MSTQVRKMDWAELKELIERRLNKLAMCKRGHVETDTNNQIEKLGKRPTYTRKQEEAIQDGLAKKIQKAMTPTLKQVRNMGPRELQSHISDKVFKIKEGAFVHPGVKAWEEKRKVINEQRAARIAELDADFQEVVDEFLLGGIDVTNFPEKLEALEMRDW